MRWAIFAIGLAAVPGRQAETIIDGASGQSMMVSAHEQSGTNLPPVGSDSSKMIPVEYFAVLLFPIRTGSIGILASAYSSLVFIARHQK